MLTIRIFSGKSTNHVATLALASLMLNSPIGRGLSLAPGAQVPDVIQKALDSAPPTRKSTSNRESLQRKRYWWLPYVVLEFDKNEILIDAMGGDLASPVWNYRADLCVNPSCNRGLSLPFQTCAHTATCRELLTSQSHLTCEQQRLYMDRMTWVTTCSWQE
jgi:hypothetical protein